MDNVALVLLCGECKKVFFKSTTRPAVIDDNSLDIAESLHEGADMRIESIDDANKREWCSCPDLG